MQVFGWAHLVACVSLNRRNHADCAFKVDKDKASSEKDQITTCPRPTVGRGCDTDAAENDDCHHLGGKREREREMATV